MNYEEKLEVLRKAGVIDMEFNKGCIYSVGGILHERDINTSRTITKEDVEMFPGCGYVGQVVYDDVLFEQNYNLNKKLSQEFVILGKDLLYGRVCRWIEENKLSEKFYDNLGIASTVEGHLKRIWHRKDLPLSQQENKEEIVGFILSLLP